MEACDGDRGRSGGLSRLLPAPLANAVPKCGPSKVDNRGLSLPFQPDDGRTAPDGGRIGNAVTSDPAIRHAINLGLDRQAVVDVALHGHGTPAFGPVDGLPWAGEGDSVA